MLNKIKLNKNKRFQKKKKKISFLKIKVRLAKRRRKPGVWLPIRVARLKSFRRRNTLLKRLRVRNFWHSYYKRDNVVKSKTVNRWVFKMFRWKRSKISWSRRHLHVGFRHRFKARRRIAEFVIKNRVFPYKTRFTSLKHHLKTVFLTRFNKLIFFSRARRKRYFSQFLKKMKSGKGLFKRIRRRRKPKWKKQLRFRKFVKCRASRKWKLLAIQKKRARRKAHFFFKINGLRNKKKLLRLKGTRRFRKRKTLKRRRLSKISNQGIVRTRHAYLLMWYWLLLGIYRNVVIFICLLSSYTLFFSNKNLIPFKTATLIRRYKDYVVLIRYFTNFHLEKTKVSRFRRSKSSLWKIGALVVYGRTRMSWYLRYTNYLLLKHTHYKVEETIAHMLQRRVLFKPSYFTKSFPALGNAKFINDYVRFFFEKGRSVSATMRLLIRGHLKQKRKMLASLVFNRSKGAFIHKQVRKQLSRRLKTSSWGKMMLPYVFTRTKYLSKKSSVLRGVYDSRNSRFLNGFLQHELFNWEITIRSFYNRKYPMIGIRIECNGPTKKGTMARMLTYHDWMKLEDSLLTGKMPNGTVDCDIQYYQSFAHTKRAAIGLKVWTLSYTPVYSPIGEDTQFLASHV